MALSGGEINVDELMGEIGKVMGEKYPDKTRARDRAAAAKDAEARRRKGAATPARLEDPGAAGGLPRRSSMSLKSR